MGVGDRYKENLNRGSYQRSRARSTAATLSKRRSNRNAAVYDRRMSRGLGFAGIGRSAWPGEKKGMDTNISLSPVINTTTTNASMFTLNLIQQGAGSWNRVGRKSHLTSLRLKGFLNWTQTPTFATGAGTSSFIRWIVVWDKQPSGAAVPTFDAIFGITAQDGTESCPDITCPLKFDVMDRYRVIRDGCWYPRSDSVPAFGTGPSMNHVTEFDEYIKLPNLESLYSGQTAPMTIADISAGALYIYFRSCLASTTVQGVNGIARIRYTD